MKRILLSLLLLAGMSLHSQPSYLMEQLGRNEHQIVQSLGAFVGNDRAESQAFDITFMPSGNNVEGVMVINTADYRCTFKMDVMRSECYEIRLDIRDPDFLREFNLLFQVYKTEGNEGLRFMNFGDKVLRVEEVTLKGARGRSFVITEK